MSITVCPAETLPPSHAFGLRSHNMPIGLIPQHSPIIRIGEQAAEHAQLAHTVDESCWVDGSEQIVLR